MRWYVGQRRRLEGEMRKYADPPSDRLLPDLPPNARHIKTLVLDLDDVLVHSDWSRGR
jgi:import inner membrane translocase subunit TIM50